MKNVIFILAKETFFNILKNFFFWVHPPKICDRSVKFCYSYRYDPLNRITSAVDNTNNYNVSNITYDKMGNIQSLTRNGFQDSSTFTDMDVLDYDYNDGNLLLKVADTGNKAYGFKDGTNTNNDFEYDANANMTIDRNKGITNISYNYLDLPDNITVNGNGNNGTVEFVYAADGLKLQKIKTENGVTVTTDYSGRYIYENGNLKQFNHSEGYVEVDGQGGYDYVYSYLDHLGTVRLTYSDFNGNGSIDPSTEILQERNTYPFGLEHEGYNNIQNGTESNYQTYLGQEMNNELGLDWLTFRYRNYMPEIGRFFGSDPISEEYFTISPYQFAHNNPVWKVEIEGLEGETSNIVKDAITHEPIKMRKLPTLSKSTVGGGKLVLKGKGTFVLKQTTKKSVLRRLSGAIARGASNTLMALLSPTTLHAPAPRNPLASDDVEFTPEQQKILDGIKKPKIDEKLRIKDLKIKVEGNDDDSPIRRMNDKIDGLKESSEEGDETKGRSTIFEREGGLDAANEVFDDLSPEGVKDIDGGRTGVLPDGSKINVRTGSRDGRTTVEIIHTNNRRTKFRFNE